MLPELIIFPSCFCNKLLNLFICLSLIFKYLSYLTLFIRFWHCSIIVVVTMDASISYFSDKILCRFIILLYYQVVGRFSVTYSCLVVYCCCVGSY